MIAVVSREAEWRDRQRRHEARLRPAVTAHLERQSRGVRHPVYDFLFEYYALAPAKLLRWTPGVGVVLQGAVLEHDAAYPEEVACGEGLWLDPAGFPCRRLKAARWILSLLEKTAARPARLGCYGLHEWAMVYRTGEIRHGGEQLRLAPADVQRVVEQGTVCCSHYDAFRFFTPAARPLNTLQPARETVAEFEQPGCLHANMDLYKWALKFHPWLASELLADAFLLALRIRELDMRASPYDLANLGFAPVRIETEEGRETYRALQEQFAGEAGSLRMRLMQAYRELLAWVEPAEAGARISA